MATMTFSLTPARLSWIMRSEERSKPGSREAIIRMIVLSLKPALTSLTTSALVIGPSSCLLCPKATAPPSNKQKVIKIVGKKDFIAHPLALWFRHFFSRRLPATQSVAFSNRFDVVACLSIGRDAATVLEHRAFTGIITRQHQIDFTAEPIHQFPHVLRTGSDVFRRVKRL